MNTKTAVLIPGRTDLHKGIYRLARRLKCDYMTVNFNKLKNLVQNDLVKQVVILKGSNKHAANTVYAELKNLNKDVRYILVDSWLWAVKDPDYSILLPGPSTEKIIEQIKGQLL